MNDTPVSPLLARVAAIAREAGEAIMGVYASDFAVEHKDDRSPLTAADLAAQTVIAQGLAALDEALPAMAAIGAATASVTVRKAARSFFMHYPLDEWRSVAGRELSRSVTEAADVARL